MDVEARIRQFETMVRPEADPDNDMAWFSLAGAYRDAGRHADAAAAYVRCYTINPAMSKAYQLAGASYIDAGQADKAAAVLTEGYVQAASRGDRLPQKAMGELLTQLGKPLPEVKAAGAPGANSAAPAGGFVCKRTGKPGTRMGRPPFKGPVGAWICENISKETFDAWIGQGTKVINEMRLDLSRDQDAATYDQQMREYLGIDDDLFEKLSSQV